MCVAKECGVLHIPIIHAAVVFEDPYERDMYLLVMQNALYVESMDHHLIPPFIMREAGLVVNDVAKIHCKQRTQADHSIIDWECKLHIGLKLEGFFFFVSNLQTNQGRSSKRSCQVCLSFSCNLGSKLF